MSDGAGPSTSRTAIVNAFKRARRKFPRNFGISSKTDDTCQSQSSENEDSSELKNIQDPTENDQSYEQTVGEQIESSLVDSFEEVGISEQVEILCDDCHSDNFETADREDIPPVHAVEEFENDLCQPVNDLQVFENDSKSVSEDNQQSYVFQESHHDFDIIWKEEPNHCIDIDNPDQESRDFPANDEILTNASESEEGNRTYEMPEQFHEQQETQQPQQSRRKKHRSGRSSRLSVGYYSCSHLKDYCCACEDSRRLHSPNCPYYGHCVHSQHCYQHCCYHNHCCCNQYCLNWQDRSTHSTRTRDSSPVSRRRSSNHRRSHRESKCSSCSSKRHSDSPKPSSQHIDSCSRDSGIFTNVRFENEDYDDADNDDTSSNALLHKDSLSILQEKYASGHYNRRSKSHRAKCDREAASEEDDECRSRKNHKLCRRLFSRCGNS